MQAAEASGRPTVVFVHGLWLLPNSWDEWRRQFESLGYATVKTQQRSLYRKLDAHSRSDALARARRSGLI